MTSVRFVATILLYVCARILWCHTTMRNAINQARRGVIMCTINSSSCGILLSSRLIRRIRRAIGRCIRVGIRIRIVIRNQL